MASRNRISRNRLQSLSRKHPEFTSPREWLEYVYNTFNIGGTVKIATVHNFIFEGASVYTISPYGEIVTPAAAAAAAELSDDAASYVRDEDVHLETTLKKWDEPNELSTLCLSNEFNDRTTSADESTLIVRWNISRTLVAKCGVFKTYLTQVVDPKRFDSRVLSSERLLPANLLHLMNENHHNSMQAVDFLLEKSERALTTATSIQTRMDDTSRKLGHITEETWRHRLASEEGAP